MHRFDAGLSWDELSELEEKLEQEWDRLSDRIPQNSREEELYLEIFKTIVPLPESGVEQVDYPEGFFEQPLEQLNGYFGLEGSRRMTERVRAALAAMWKWNACGDDYDEALDELFGGEEEEEENEDE